MLIKIVECYDMAIRISQETEKENPKPGIGPESWEGRGTRRFVRGGFILVGKMLAQGFACASVLNAVMIFLAS